MAGPTWITIYTSETKVGNRTFYFATSNTFYFLDDDLPQGWVVGPELLEDTFYIQTLNNVSPCPVGRVKNFPPPFPLLPNALISIILLFSGIFGGYSSNDLSKRDNSFTIDCHSDAVKVSCCPSINISSGSQQGVAGMYEKVGDHNGHPWYQVSYCQARVLVFSSL